MAKKGKRKAIERVRKDQKTGMRTLKKDGRTKSKFSNFGVVGNLIRSDAQVSNILKYVDTASTVETPYLITTLSRYQALVPNKTRILDQVLGSYQPKTDSPFTKIAKDIKEHEGKEISALLGPVWGETNPDTIVKNMNLLKVKANGTVSSIKDLVNKNRQALQNAFFEYKLANKDYAKEVSDLYTMAMNDPDQFVGVKIGEVKGLEKIRYRNLGKGITKKMLEAIKVFIEVVDRVEIDIKGKDTIEKALSSMVLPLMNSSKQSVYGEGASAAEAAATLKELARVQKNFESKLDAKIGKIGLNRGWFNSGNYAEVLGAGLLIEALEEQVKATEKDNFDPKKENDKLIKEGTKMAVKIVSDDDKKWKTADNVLIINGGQVGIDIKTHSQEKTEKFGGLVYESSMTVDFKIAHKALMNSNSLPPSIFKMYRAYMLNQGLNDGYNITSIKEREMYVQEYLRSPEGLEYKFKSDGLSESGNGYPYLVQINGRYHRFSDVLEKMNNREDFFSSMSKGNKGAIPVGKPASLSKYGMETQTLYMNKIEAGAARDSLGNMIGSRTIPGFSEQVKGLKVLVNNIENDYFGTEGTKKKVRFTIALRK